MGSEGHGRPKLTAKGERTRARIVAEAARLIYEHGVAGTKLDDVRAAAEVSGSQMYHYFADKDELVQAVIAHQADVIAAGQRQADLSSAAGLSAWRDTVIAQAAGRGSIGGCPLGALAGQLAETDPAARALLASGFARWQAAIADGLRRLRDAGQLPADADPDALAVTLLATLQGGLLLAQVQRDTRPLETAVSTLLQLLRDGNPLRRCLQHVRSDQRRTDEPPWRIPRRPARRLLTPRARTRGARAAGCRTTRMTSRRGWPATGSGWRPRASTSRCTRCSPSSRR